MHIFHIFHISTFPCSWVAPSAPSRLHRGARRTRNVENEENVENVDNVEMFSTFFYTIVIYRNFYIFHILDLRSLQKRWVSLVFGWGNAGNVDLGLSVPCVFTTSRGPRALTDYYFSRQDLSSVPACSYGLLLLSSPDHVGPAPPVDSMCDRPWAAWRVILSIGTLQLYSNQVQEI